MAANDSSDSRGPAVRFADRVEARGETAARLTKAYDRLCSPPLSDAEFVLSDVSFHFKRRFTEYSGDVSGRMLGALNSAAPVIGRDVPSIDVLVKGFFTYQKPDGHFGADQNLNEKVDQARDMPILWGNGRLLLALAERLRGAPDAEMRAMAKRLGDYAVSTRKYYGKRENFEHVGGVAASGYTTCYPSLIDGLAAIGEVSGDSRYYEEVRFISKLSLLDREFLKHHSHGRLTAYRGMLDLDRFTGRPEFLDAVRAGCKTIVEAFIMPTGGVQEYFDRTYNRDEGCSEGDWLRVNFLLWVATGDTAYLDMAEHILRNHIYATQFPNGGFGHRDFVTLKDGGEAYPFGGISNRGSESYWCCAMHNTQVLADAARWGVVAADGKLLITWLSEVRSTLSLPGSQSPVTFTVAHQEAGAWRVTLESASAIDVTVGLRVPSGREALVVDTTRIASENGWALVKRKGTGPITLNVEIPRGLRPAGVYTPRVEEGKAVRLFQGPNLLCLPDVQVGQGLLPSDEVPTLLVDVQQQAGGQVPVIIAGHEGKMQRASLVPISRRPFGGARYLFRVRNVGAEEFEKSLAAAAPMPKPGTPMELEIGCDGEGRVYLNGAFTHGCGGTDESPQVEVYSDRSENVVAVVAHSRAPRPALIGAIRVGDQTIVTRPEDWTVVPVPDKVPAAWLADSRKGLDQAVTLADLGGFGVPPWKHVPADYAGTPARWIWPEASGKPQDQRWLFRHRFSLAR